MRSIAVVVLLATCSHVLADGTIPFIVQANNALGSIVALENSILAPLAPFGRKLQTFIPGVPSPDPNVVKANAIGSILYTAGGLYNTELYKTALTGTTGRKLSQVPKGPDGFPDPYGFIPKANLVASIFKGKLPTGRKLQEAESELNWDAESVRGALGFNRKLQQDNVIANSLGSIIYGGVQTLNIIKSGRKLKQVPSILDPTRTGFLGTGSVQIKNNALASIAADPLLINDPLTVRQATLGFQQSSGRKLFGAETKEAAAGSLAAGDITYDNVHKAIFGFNQGQEGRHLLSEATKMAAAGSLAAGDITYDNVHKAVFGFNQGQEGRHLLSEETKMAAAGSLAAGDITYDNVHKAIFGFNQGQEGRRLLSEETKMAAAGSLAAGDITYDNVHKAIFGFNQGQEGRRLLSEETKVAAAGSLAAGDITYDNVHKAIFGFNQGQEGRHLLSEATKIAAAGSLAAGDITYDNVHKAVFGFNQGQEGRHLLSEATKMAAAGSLAAGDITYDNVHKAVFGFNQGQNRRLLAV